MVKKEGNEGLYFRLFCILIVASLMFSTIINDIDSAFITEDYSIEVAKTAETAGTDDVDLKRTIEAQSSGSCSNNLANNAVPSQPESEQESGKKGILGAISSGISSTIKSYAKGIQIQGMAVGDQYCGASFCSNSCCTDTCCSSSSDVCCGGDCMSPSNEFCCDGNICGGVDDECCGSECVNNATEVCCGGVVCDKDDCCGNTCIDPNRNSCCNGVVCALDRCMPYVEDPEPPTSNPCDNRGSGSVSCIPGTNYVELSQSNETDPFNVLVNDTTSFDFSLKGLEGIPGSADPADIMFVVDRSGSMAAPKITQAKNALYNIYDAIKQFDSTHTEANYFRTGVASFNHKSQTNAYLDFAVYSQFPFTNLVPCGMTCIGCGINEANNKNLEVGAYACLSPTVNKIMIIASDGMENTAPYLATIKPTYLPKDMTFYTIGVGTSGSWTNKLKDIAENWGNADGAYYSASDASGLTNIYEDIVGKYISEDPANNAVVTIRLADNIRYMGSSLPPASVSGNTITWDIDTIQENVIKQISVDIMIEDGSGMIGVLDTANSKASIFNRCGTEVHPFSQIYANITPGDNPGEEENDTCGDCIVDVGEECDAGTYVSDCIGEISSTPSSFYDFESGFSDGYDNNDVGSLVNSIIYNESEKGNVLSLTGSNSYATITNSADFNLNQFTIGAWVKSKTFLPGYIISKKTDKIQECGPVPVYESPINAECSSQYSSSYKCTNMLDGSTLTQWYSSSVGAKVVTLTLNETKCISGIQNKIHSSYLNQIVLVEGSNDKTNWNTILGSWTMPLITSITTFSEVQYQYIRLTYLSLAGRSYANIQENTLLVSDYVDIENMPFSLSTLNGCQFEVIKDGNRHVMYGYTNVNDGQWHHIAVTYNGSIMRFYVDGIQKSMYSGLAGPLPITAKDIIIGKTYAESGDSWYYNGYIDDIMVYDTPLSGSDIFTLANVNSNSSNKVCRLDCTLGSCGDGILDSGEQCDDGNDIGTDGCDNCFIEVGIKTTGLSEDINKPTEIQYVPGSLIADNIQIINGDIFQINSYYLTDSSGVCNDAKSGKFYGSQCSHSFGSTIDCTIAVDSGYPYFNAQTIIYGCTKIGSTWYKSHPEYLIVNQSLPAVCGDGSIVAPETCEVDSDCTSYFYCHDCQCIDIHTTGLSEDPISPTLDTYAFGMVIEDDINFSSLGSVTVGNAFITDYNGDCTNGPVPGTSCILPPPASMNADCSITLDSGFSYFENDMSFYGCILYNGTWYMSHPEYLYIESICGDGAVYVPGADNVLSTGDDEECDDDNTANGDGCSAICKLEIICGDGVIQDPNSNAQSEQCDDGNMIDGDGCSSICQLESPAFCGDGEIQTPNSDGVNEVCDDGNTMDGDGCSSDCLSTDGSSYCGDGTTQSPNDNSQYEECDDSNAVSGDGCSDICLNELFPSTCGDGEIQNPNTDGVYEECDDHNTANGDGCSSICTLEGGGHTFCGDGTTQTPNSNGQNEQCDDHNTLDGDGCSAICILEGGGLTFCGDGTTQTPNSNGQNEECDDSNTLDGDGCDSGCMIETFWTFCGDGTTQAPNSNSQNEECDDGNTLDGDGCSDNCQIELFAAFCGDGTVQAPNSNGGYEQCDDHNTINGDGCSATCTVEPGHTFCGDGTTQNPNNNGQNEQCDDHNTIDGDGCSATCTLEGGGHTFCSDGTIQNPNTNGQYEECDDGNALDGDGCSDICALEGNGHTFCGDGSIQTPNSNSGFEQCDDHNTIDGDGCSATCILEGGGYTFCGDGILQEPNSYGEIEECDDGNTLDGDGCSAVCLIDGSGMTFCSDGNIQYPNANGQYEECDDNNAVSGDGCSNICLNEIFPSTCSDGEIQWPNTNGVYEECDDSNTADGDGCSATCTLEGGSYTFCGDGSTQAPNTNGQYEECDDHNALDGDGCSAICVLEGGGHTFCGDGTVQNPNTNGQPETCDDGNTLDGDGCSAQCLLDGSGMTFCSDGTVQNPNSNGQSEQCDDSNAVSGDGCSEICLNENSPSSCGDGAIQRPNTDSEYEQCDDGNTLSGDGCSALCIDEGTPFCGNGVVDAGESCDDHNALGGDGCSSACTLEPGHTFCGDGFIQNPNDNDQNELCDDFNTLDGDGCSALCTLEGRGHTFCGDGSIQAPNSNTQFEQCDDGNVAGGDGCSATCTMEPGHTFCGDGDIQNPNDNGQNEQCDDSNALDGDGCESCGLTLLTYCGDGTIQSPNSLGLGGPFNDGFEQCEIDANCIFGEVCQNCACVIPTCVLDTVNISLQDTNTDGNATPGEIVDISGNFSADCSSADYIQVDASGGGCAIQWIGGDMLGIGGPLSIFGNNFTASWVVPSIDVNCYEKTAFMTNARFWSGNPDGTAVGAASLAFGSLTFGLNLCGNMFVDLGEECDPLGGSFGDANCTISCQCTAAHVPYGVEGKCRPLVCNYDGVYDVFEECDDGNHNSYDGCIDCILPVCGDGFKWLGHEDCDDGPGGFCPDNCYNMTRLTDVLNKQLVKDKNTYDTEGPVYRGMIKYFLLNHNFVEFNVYNPLIAENINIYDNYLSPDNCLESIKDGESCIQLWFVSSAFAVDVDLYDLPEDIEVGKASNTRPLNPLDMFVRYNMKDPTRDPDVEESSFFSVRLVPSKENAIPAGAGVIRSPSNASNMSDWDYINGYVYNLNHQGNWSCINPPYDQMPDELVCE